MEAQKNSQNSSEPKKKQLSTYIKYSGLGFQMIATMVVAAWGGMWLDEHFKVKSHLFTLFLLVFAVISSIYFVIRGLINSNKD